MLLGFETPPTDTKHDFPSATFFTADELKVLIDASRPKALSRASIAWLKYAQGTAKGLPRMTISPHAVEANEIHSRASAALKLSQEHTGEEPISPYLHLEPKLAEVAIGFVRSYAQTPDNVFAPHRVVAAIMAEQAEEAGL